MKMKIKTLIAALFCIALFSDLFPHILPGTDSMQTYDFYVKEKNK